ncbi:IS110 family transposase [Streptomyces spectabilis]|uniref:IS110 family transposase n=1 Tax=Streptomyces spectabilis TaxID=68270 RepID=UPI001E2FC278|nr:IS110 family transposase [Streptomyces spectabilis]
MLLYHGQSVFHLSGRAIHRASESYRGEGQADAKDAAVIANQVCVRTVWTSCTRAMRPPPISRCLLGAASTWSPTAPAPSIAFEPS